MNAPLTLPQLQAMLDLSEALRFRLLDENNALKAEPSCIFTPQADTPAGRQFEREAFAKGLHLAAHSKFKKD